MKKYTYHYHGSVSKVSGVSHYDGIITQNKPIKTQKDYTAIKSAIIANFDELEGILPSNFIIMSMSLL